MLQSKQSQTNRKYGIALPQGVKSISEKGLPVGGYLLFTMVLGFLTVCATFSFLAFRYIPDIINNQIDLRNQAITTSFRNAIKKPLLLRDYLQVNQEARATSKLPGVAYAAVINNKGVVVGGFFSDLSRFEGQFAAKVKEKGFPVDIFYGNRLGHDQEEASAKLTIAGQRIYDKVQRVPDIGAEVHVGIFVTEVEDAIRHALISPLTIFLAFLILVLGAIFFFLLNRAITKPLEQVTDVVNRISLGEMNLEITPNGPREIRDLAKAFTRMQQSIRYVLAKLNES